MATKNRQTRAKKRETEADRLRSVYTVEWESDPRRAKRKRDSLTEFAALLGYRSHSSVSGMMSGTHAVQADVARGCHKQWGISPTWLLCGIGPRAAYNIVEPAILADQLETLMRAAIAEASTPELPLDGGTSDDIEQGLTPGVDISVRKAPFQPDGKAAIAFICAKAVEEAKTIALWRDEMQIRSAVQLARTTGGPPGYDPSVILHAPWIKRASFRHPPLPDTKLVQGV